MNNPFGMPDEMFETMLAQIVKDVVSSNPAPGKTRQPNSKATPEEGAKAIKKIYDSYIEVGFNEVQAFELLKLVLTHKN